MFKQFSLAGAIVVAMVCVTQASVMPDPDYHYQWWGPGAGWLPVVDTAGLGEPLWMGEQDLFVPNTPMPPPWHKDVVIEAVFTGPAPLPQLEEMVIGANGLSPDEFNVGPEDWTVVWHLPDQPPEEVIQWALFPWGYHLQTLTGDQIAYMDVATKCVPEPGTIYLLIIGALTLLWFWTRR